MLNWALAFFLVAIVAAIFRYHRASHSKGWWDGHSTIGIPGNSGSDPFHGRSRKQ